LAAGSPCKSDVLTCAFTEVSGTYEFLLTPSVLTTIQTADTIPITIFPIVNAAAAFSYTIEILIPT